MSNPGDTRVLLWVVADIRVEDRRHLTALTEDRRESLTLLWTGGFTDLLSRTLPLHPLSFSSPFDETSLGKRFSVRSLSQVVYWPTGPMTPHKTFQKQESGVRDGDGDGKSTFMCSTGFWDGDVDRKPECHRGLLRRPTSDSTHRLSSESFPLRRVVQKTCNRST